MQDDYATREVGSWPVAGHEFPAQIDRTRPTRFLIRRPQILDPHTAQVRGKEQAEQVAKTMRLGIDPSTMPPPPARPTRLRDMYRGALNERVGNTPLPDGRRQVTAEEADEPCVSGEAATARTLTERGPPRPPGTC